MHGFIEKKKTRVWVQKCIMAPSVFNKRSRIFRVEKQAAVLGGEVLWPGASPEEIRMAALLVQSPVQTRNSRGQKCPHLGIPPGCRIPKSPAPSPAPCLAGPSPSVVVMEGIHAHTLCPPPPQLLTLFLFKHFTMVAFGSTYLSARKLVGNGKPINRDQRQVLTVPSCLSIFV